MTTLTLAIDGMHCAACVRRVTTLLSKLEGLTPLDVAIGSATVEVTPSAGAGGMDAARIAQALTAGGYPARAAPAPGAP